MRFALEPWLAERRARVEEALERALPAEAALPAPLLGAMRHSLFAGGKRLRPILAFGSAEALAAPASVALEDFAIALEFVHTYSLIHDDLPAMDDDDWRRGKPTCHKVFGEAMAILAGDALLTEAFARLGREATSERAALAGLLGSLAGAWGMVGGQADDIRADRPGGLAFLETLHRRKTGALIAAACAGGALAAGGAAGSVEALRRYGEHLGLAFQIRDDLLDLEGDRATLGKTVGKDAAQGKLTFPALLGAGAAAERARAEAEQAAEAVAALPQPEALQALAWYAVERDH